MSYDLSDGARVSYVGDETDGRALGDRGHLLVRQGSLGHVKWDDGTITPHRMDFLAKAHGGPSVPHQRRDELDDSLDVGPIHATGVRGTYDTEGSPGVLNALSSSGALVAFPSIAEDALAFVAQRIRQETVFRQAATELDDDETEDLVRLASAVLLRDAFGSEGYE